MQPGTNFEIGASADLIAVIYELLDAHNDTARLAEEHLADDERWRAHVAYLRDLQRVGRETLAHA